MILTSLLSSHDVETDLRQLIGGKFQAEKGGYKTFVMEVKGTRVYSKLKYESGVHRVQRVPQTEAQGRVHTSTATVAIMPEVKSNYARNVTYFRWYIDIVQNVIMLHYFSWH